MKLPVAVQLYSVRDEMQDDFYGTIKKMKEYGYDGVEFAGLFGEEPAKIREFCNEIGIVPISAHVPYYDMLADPRRCSPTTRDRLQICRRALSDRGMPPRHRRLYRHRRGIRKIAEAAKKLGIQLLYHNHDFEFVKLDGEYALDVLYSTIPADLLQTEIDTCWVKVAASTPRNT